MYEIYVAPLVLPLNQFLYRKVNLSITCGSFSRFMVILLFKCLDWMQSKQYFTYERLCVLQDKLVML